MPAKLFKKSGCWEVLDTMTYLLNDAAFQREGCNEMKWNNNDIHAIFSDQHW